MFFNCSLLLYRSFVYTGFLCVTVFWRNRNQEISLMFSLCHSDYAKSRDAIRKSRFKASFVQLLGHSDFDKSSELMQSINRVSRRVITILDV